MSDNNNDNNITAVAAGFAVDENSSSNGTHHHNHDTCITDYATKQRRILRYVADRVVPNYDEIDLVDAINVVSILVDTGLVDLQKRPNFDFFFETGFNVDNNNNNNNINSNKNSTTTNKQKRKRITYVHFGDSNKALWHMQHMQQHQSAVDSIRRLDMLEGLGLGSCGLLSRSAIESIFELPSLKRLNIWTMVEDHAVNNLLNDLLHININNKNNNNNSHTTASSFYPFQQNLEELKLCNCGLTEDHLETLLLDILPRFPKLAKIGVYDNKIETLQKISNRIIENTSTNTNTNGGEPFVLSRSTTTTTTTGDRHHQLRHLDLTFNPVNNTEQLVEERASLKIILRAFRGLYGFPMLSRLTRIGYDSELDYLLRINCAGRVLIEGGGGGVTATATTATTDVDSTSTNEYSCTSNSNSNNNNSTSTSKIRLFRYRCGPLSWQGLAAAEYIEGVKILILSPD